MIQQAGLNNEKIQQSNRSLVLDMIIRHYCISRKELVDITGLKKPTITNIVNEFLGCGIVNARSTRRMVREKQRDLFSETFQQKSFQPDGCVHVLKLIYTICQAL